MLTFYRNLSILIKVDSETTTKRTVETRVTAHYSEVAQLVEHPAVNRQVAGSSPAFGAMLARWSSG